MAKSRLPRDPREIITSNVTAQPAAIAWKRLARGAAAVAVPARVEMLRRRRKSVVYRLPGVGHAGADVIAKHCVRESALAEHRMYLLLQELHIAHPDYYGYVDGEEEDFGWIFLGDAAGEVYDPTNSVQRRLATSWLALLHTLSSRLPSGAALPDRGPAHYLEHLRAARAGIDQIRTTLKMSPEADQVLGDALLWLELTEERWSDVEALCGDLPATLVHGDFAERNVRVRHNHGAGAVLLVFDWEVAGWGMPGVDLDGVDRDAYLEQVRPTWPHLDREDVRRAIAVGRLVRGGLAAMHWETHKIIGKYPEHTLDNVLIFRQRIIDNLQELGWCAPSVRSFPVTPTPDPDGIVSPETKESTGSELRTPRASLPRRRES